MSAFSVLLMILLSNTLSKPIEPFWKWTWNTLPVWAASESSPSGLPTEAIDLFTKYPIMITQGALTLNGTEPGYENWEQGTISDAKRIHNVNPNETIFGYYGFPGCCAIVYSSHYPTYLNRTDLHLYDDNNRLCKFYNTTPCFNYCADGMYDFYTNTILNDFVSSDEISGVFLDETEAYVEGPQSYWNNMGYYFTNESQYKLLQCYQNGMVNITKYLTTKNMFAIPSSNAYYNQFPVWNNAQNQVIEDYGGFKFIEVLECYGNGTIYNVSNDKEWNNIVETKGFGTKQWQELMYSSIENGNINNVNYWWDCPTFNNDTNDCCKSQILTAINVSQHGGLLMIRATQSEDEYAQRYYAVAAFLLTAYKWSYFAGGTGWNGVSSFPWFNIYDYPIGQPLNDTMIHDKNQTVFSRQFNNVYVSFNLSQGVAALYFNWNQTN